MKNKAKNLRSRRNLPLSHYSNFKYFPPFNINTNINIKTRPSLYRRPFITIARAGSNFPGEKMSALLLSIPQWDSFY